MRKDELKEYAELLDHVFEDLREDLFTQSAKAGRHEDYELFKRTFVFHMTDWINDLRQLHALVEVPDLCDAEKARSIVVNFLYHVIPHLRAAGRLLLDEIPDAFHNDDVMAKLNALAEADAVDQPH